MTILTPLPNIYKITSQLLDKNAPFKTTKVYLRNTNAWWNNELSVLHRIIRKNEFIRRKYKNTINYNDDHTS